MHTYKIVEKNENPKQNVIEKTGITARFTLEEIEQAEKANAKSITELKAMMNHRDAVMKNVVVHHPNVLTISEEDRYAVHMFQEAFAFNKQAEVKLKELEEAQEGSIKERAEITLQVVEIKEKKAKKVKN